MWAPACVSRCRCTELQDKVGREISREVVRRIVPSMLRISVKYVVSHWTFSLSQAYLCKMKHRREHGRASAGPQSWLALTQIHRHHGQMSHGSLVICQVVSFFSQCRWSWEFINDFLKRKGRRFLRSMLQFDFLRGRCSILPKRPVACYLTNEKAKDLTGQ